MCFPRNNPNDVNIFFLLFIFEAFSHVLFCLCFDIFQRCVEKGGRRRLLGFGDMVVRPRRYNGLFFRVHDDHHYNDDDFICLVVCLHMVMNKPAY